MVFKHKTSTEAFTENKKVAKEQKTLSYMRNSKKNM